MTRLTHRNTTCEVSCLYRPRRPQFSTGTLTNTEIEGFGFFFSVQSPTLSMTHYALPGEGQEHWGNYHLVEC